jgi:hypothetical protein
VATRSDLDDFTHDYVFLGSMPSDVNLRSATIRERLSPVHELTHLTIGCP